MKIPSPFQLHGLIQGLILAAWILFALFSFVLFHNSTRGTPTYRWIAYGGTFLISAFIVWFWWYTAYTGSGDSGFAWRQLPPTLMKVAIQTALPALAVYCLYVLSRQLGEKALPHLYGIEFKPQWIPSIQVVLPTAVLWGSLVLAFVCALSMVFAVLAYGAISPMGICALAGLALILGSWGRYRCLHIEKNDALKAMVPLVRALPPGPSPQKDAMAMGEYRRLVEYKLGTREWNAMVFHRMADEPFGLSYRFPGFLIGVEQANRYLIGLPDSANVTEKGKGVRGIAALLNDRRRTFVSHILEFEDQDANSLDKDKRAAPKTEMVKTTTLYNIYEVAGPKDEEEAKHGNPFHRGFVELKALGNTLDKRLESANGKPPEKDSSAWPPEPGAYTHILVYCMGWNTDQQESIRNYNSLMGYLTKAAKQPDGKTGFRPLVIGLSWPSEWSFLKPLSYVAKAGDADETGLVWGSYLLKKVLKPLKLKYRLPLVLIGHSFGARVLTRAVASNPDWVVEEKGDEYVELKDFTKKEIDLFIGLQGAFSANRFVATGALISGWWEGSPYAGLLGKPTRFIFTWAKKDNANPIAAYVTGAHHVGGRFGHEFCLQHLDAFWPAVYAGKRNGAKPHDWPYVAEEQWYNPENGWGDLPDSTNRKIFTMDVSGIVKEQPYGKGGGAHSDIYTPEMGRFLWDSIRKFAPSRI